MATRRREKPYTWVTWITPHLAGEAQCLYAPWIQSQFQIEKLERGGFDLVKWKADHQQMVEARAAELVNDGWTVRVEDQNAFKIEGKVTTLAGKCDLVALKGDDLLVVDCKSGKRKSADVFQVLLYMFAIPLYHPFWTSSRRVAGEVRYTDGALPIAPEQFTGEIRQRIVTLVTRMGNVAAPAATASSRECAFCHVSKMDCTYRIETVDAPVLTSEW